MKRHIFNSNFTCVRTITIIAAAATLTVSCGIYKKYEREENVVSDSLFGEEYRTADTCALADLGWMGTVYGSIPGHIDFQRIGSEY